MSLYSEYVSTVSFDALNEILKDNSCPTLTEAEAPPPSPATLAERAAASFELPSPSGGRYPDGKLPAGTGPAAGTPYTIVRAYTWFWTNAASWKTYTATARAGGNYATVTARPTQLSMLPGDGNAAVSCAGPGSVRDRAEDPAGSSWNIPSPSGCQYEYPDSSLSEPGEVVTATFTITWQLTWTGSGNTSGTLTNKATTSKATFAVAELQSVVTR